MSLAIFFVKVVPESFQIYIGSTQVRSYHFQGFPGRIAVGHKDIGQACFFCQDGRIVGIFKKYCWFGIGVGDARTIVELCFCHNLRRWQRIAGHGAYLLQRSLRYPPVLAKATFKITADSGNGIGSGAWEKMIKRFLLDRVDIGGDDITINHAVKSAANILSHAAEAKFCRRDSAFMGAEIAVHLVVLKFLPK